ncbi:MAG: hypothetical protein ABIQ41_07360 [Gemmatimonadales bacterium]
MRCAPKRYRKRHGLRDSRGRPAGKRPITARPACVDARARPCALSLIERKTG